jgi:hypothetical protein
MAMRFRRLQNRRVSARTSDAVSPARLSTPRPPPPRTVQWRSLWGRVYARWAAAPPPPPPRPPFSPTESPRSTVLFPAESKQEMPPQPTPHGPQLSSHARLRAYLQRRRGELWFLTKRRRDADLHVPGEAEEVEVPPPPLVRARGSDPTSAVRPLQSLLTITVEDNHSSSFSELEIGMSSYSDSSGELEDDEGEEPEDASDRDDGSITSDTATTRDSYATAMSDSDLFLRRYSSWCSIDDEQTATARASSVDHDDDNVADDPHAEDADDEGDEELDSRSPTLEQLYGVRYVDNGGSPTPGTGIWV